MALFSSRNYLRLSVLLGVVYLFASTCGRRFFFFLRASGASADAGRFATSTHATDGRGGCGCVVRPF
jgi:hypothetical protein